MVDVNKALGILNELEIEYLRLGSTVCHNLEDKTPLSAFLLLGLRSTGLLKSLLLLLQPSTAMAGCDAVERAFLETSQLQLEFRFLDATDKIKQWFAGRPDSWKSDKGKLNTFVQAQKGTGFGREYGDFSTTTHPTIDACRHSVALVTSSRRINSNSQQLQHTLEVRSGNYANLVFREVWTALMVEPHLIEIPIDRIKIPQCVGFVDEFNVFLQHYQTASSSTRTP